MSTTVDKAANQRDSDSKQPVVLVNETTDTYQHVLLILGGCLSGLIVCGCIFTVVKCLRSMKLKNTRITSETGAL